MSQDVKSRNGQLNPREPRNDKYIMPAEFEPQSSIWMGWPKFQWYSELTLDTRQPIAEIIATLSQHEIDVRIMCTDEQGENDAKAWLTDHGFSITPHMLFVHIDQVDIWMRDYGPIFVRNASNKLGMTGFAQNQWGYSTKSDPTSQAMTEVPSAVARYLGIDHLVSVELVSEGGDRMVNGRGTLLVCKAVEFQRNPAVPAEALECGYQAGLGVTDIIWLDSGVREDLHSDWGPIPYSDDEGNTIRLYGPQTTGGHLDELVRFASPSKIVLAQVTEEEAANDPIAAVNYARCESVYRVLAHASDQAGAPFEIVRLPVPDIQYMSVAPGERMYEWLAGLTFPLDVPQFPTGSPINVVKAASYANYLVTNGLVIAPKYGNQEKDEAAASALMKAYEGRVVVQIDPSVINYAGGGIHCCTQQQPVGNT